MQLAQRLTAHTRSHVGMGSVTDLNVLFLDEKELFYPLELLQSVHRAIRAHKGLQLLLALLLAVL